MLKVLFVFLFFFNALYAENNFTIKTSYYLTKENLNLEEIKQIKEFTPSKGKNFGIAEQNVWLKVEIRNHSKEVLNRIFKFSFPYMDDISIYKSDGSIEKYGRTNPYNTKIHSIDNNVFEVSLNPLEQKTIYIKIISSFAVKTFLEDFNKEEYLENIFFKKALFYFCYGIIFALIVYNFFIWFVIRKKEFLYYILFHFTLFMGIVSWTGFGFQYLWPGYPEFNYYSYGIIANLIFGFQILYVVYYLDMDSFLPKTTIFLKYFSKLFFFFSISSLFIQLTLFYEIVSVFSTFFLLGITIYLTFVKKLRLAFYIFIAELILILGNFFMVLSDMGITQGSFYMDHFYVWGASIEVILISFALSYKYKILEDEKNAQEQKRAQMEEILIGKQKLSSIGENFNNLVHQFRQPLAQINSLVYSVYTNYINKNLTPQVLEKNLNYIESQTIYLSKTLEYFNSFTSNQEENEKFLFSELMDKVEILTEFILKKYNITMQIEYDKDITLYTNQTQLLQVILIIITNAKDAFIKNNIKEPLILLKIEKKDSFLNISITNNAGAIDPLVKEKIFEPYFTTKKDRKGSGLGLYIAKLIVEEKLHSSISLSSKGDFTTFKINIII